MLFTMIAIAWAVRLLVAALLYGDLLDPARNYWNFGWEVGSVARSLALHQGFGSPLHGMTGPTAILPPIYPFLVAIVFRLCGLHSALSAFVILGMNGLLSSLTCIPIYYAAKRSLGARTAKYASWLWVFYPNAIYFSAGRVWDYALATLMLALCFWATLSLQSERRMRYWIACGALWGLTALVNPSVLAAFFPLLAWAAYYLGKKSGSWKRNCLSAILAAIAVISPWCIRNYSVMHIVAPIRDNFWMEFWVGNTGDTSNLVPKWAHPSTSDVEMEKFQSEGETAYIRDKRRLSLEFLSHHPGLFFQLCLRRMVYYWTGVWSFQRAYLSGEPTAIPNIFFCSVLLVFMAKGIAHWWHRNPKTLMPYLALIVFFPVVYYITHVLMDYRQPIEPAVVVLVTVGWRSFRKLPNDKLEVGTSEAF